jgi:hypothetical protein
LMAVTTRSWWLVVVGFMAKPHASSLAMVSK